MPMICIPVFADQKRNAKLLERRGTALILDKGKMNKDDVVAAIKKIIADPSYRENAKLVARMIKVSVFELLLCLSMSGQKYGIITPKIKI